MASFLFSNSSTKTYQTCPRAFYHNYLHSGTGLTGRYVDENLAFGSAVHDLMPAVWDGQCSMEDLRAARTAIEAVFVNDAVFMADAAPAARVMKAAEWGRLLEGMITAYSRHVLTFLQRDYRMVAAEADMVQWLSAEVGLIAKPDALLYGASEAAYPGTGYLEFKTVASPDAKWHQQWHRNPQTWTGAMALRASMKIDIDWFVVCGLVKGQERDGWRNSALCWAWRLAPNGGSGKASVVADEATLASDGSKWSHSGTTAKGWVKTSTDEFPGGVSAWVRTFSEAQLAAHVVLTEPVTIEWNLAEEWLQAQQPLIDAARTAQELGWTTPLDTYQFRSVFPRMLSECKSGRYGKPCTYGALCHNPMVAEDPIGSGKYQKRRFHHPLEVALAAEKG